MATAPHVETIPDYITPAQIARRLPPNRGDKPVHVASVIRWITHGARALDGSRVKLRAVRLPGGWRSTWAWVEDFFSALTTAAEGDVPPPPEPPASRRRQHERAERELVEAGF